MYMSIALGAYVGAKFGRVHKDQKLCLSAGKPPTANHEASFKTTKTL